MIKRDLPGYAIGGLSGGEDKGSVRERHHRTSYCMPVVLLHVEPVHAISSGAW